MFEPVLFFRASFDAARGEQLRLLDEEAPERRDEEVLSYFRDMSDRLTNHIEQSLKLIFTDRQWRHQDDHVP